MFAALDRRPWVVPLVVFVVVAATATTLRVFDIFISFTNGPVRQQFYSSLAGSSSALLGFLIAAVTILAAFGKRQVQGLQEQQKEQSLAVARTRLVALLLCAALFMLVVLICASLALALSNSAERLATLDTLIVAAAAAGLVGIAYGCIGLGLAVAERSR